MLPLLTSPQIREADSYTIANELFLFTVERVIMVVMG